MTAGSAAAPTTMSTWWQGQELLDVDGALCFAKGAGAYAAGYDANGNMLVRVVDSKTHLQGWDAETCLISLTQGTPTATFTYDALDRLTGVAPVSGWQGYTGTYAYSPTGNLMSATYNGVAWVYVYPNSGAGSVRPHAVSGLSNGWSYQYDANGNQTQRTVAAGTYVLTYNVENQLVRVSGPATAAFGYDGDGKLVTATTSGTTTFYVGNYYEKTGSTVRKYYYHGGRRVAMRENGVLSWLLTDQLGSTAMTLTASAGITGELRYKAYGETRYTYGTTSTKYRFTGQREESTIGLYFYNARWYDAALGRFAQADAVVPEPGDPQALNRYSYVSNNPLKLTDPSGHAEDVGAGQASEEYLWWSLFHPDMPKWWWIWYYASGALKNLVGAGTFSQYGQDIVAEAARYDIPAADLFGIVRQEAPNPTKPLAFLAALADKDTTIGVAEVSVSTASDLVGRGQLPGPQGLALVARLGLSGRYSIRAGAAAYKRAEEVAKKDLPDLPDTLRQYYVLAMYNRGRAETVAELHGNGVGAFTPEAVQYIHYVRQYSPGQREMQFWALVSNIVEFVGGPRW